MVRRRRLLTLAAITLAGLLPGSVLAQLRLDHPKLRAALDELREAQRELGASTDAWPAGYKDRAIESIGDAIGSVKAILNAKNADKFRGVDRGPDYYRRFKDHPRLRAALADLRDARAELLKATADTGDLKERAIDDIDVAVGDILRLVRADREKR